MDLPHHPFRFGIQASSAPDAATWADTARRAEDLGYSVLSVAEHHRDQFATTPAMMAAAAATTMLRVGSIVYCNDLHHPAMLAKEAATVDLLSDGRLELGLGAGWMPEDYEYTGTPLILYYIPWGGTGCREKKRCIFLLVNNKYHKTITTKHEHNKHNTYCNNIYI